MTRLPDLEHRLVEAARRLEAPAAATTGAAAAPAHGGRLRRRWRRLSRGGHIAGVLVGGLLLGAVATGSAQVAGLDPWGKLVGQDQINPELRATGGAEGSVGVRVEDAPDHPGWELRAYVARNGQVCVTAAGRGGEGLYDCRTSDHAAALLAGRPDTGRLLAGVTQTGPPTMTPRRVVAWALTDWSAPPARFSARPGTTVRISAPDRPLRLAVDRSATGLSARGRALVATLPAELTLRLTVAELTSATARGFGGGAIATPSVPKMPGGVTTVQIESASAWAKAHHAHNFSISDDGTLDRSSAPVAGATEQQMQTYPALARPRAAGDAIPRSALTDELRHGRIQAAGSRRLSVTGTGDLGATWVAPGGLSQDFTVPSVDGQVCLAGPAVLSGCQSTAARGVLADPEAVVCAAGLPRDKFLVWGFVPAGADHVRVDYDGATSTRFPAADLLVLLQDRAAPRPARLMWSGPNGFARTSRVVFPRNAASAICGAGQAPHYRELRQSASTSAESHW